MTDDADRLARIAAEFTAANFRTFLGEMDTRDNAHHIWFQAITAGRNTGLAKAKQIHTPDGQDPGYLEHLADILDNATKNALHVLLTLCSELNVDAEDFRSVLYPGEPNHRAEDVQENFLFAWMHSTIAGRKAGLVQAGYEPDADEKNPDVLKHLIDSLDGTANAAMMQLVIKAEELGLTIDDLSKHVQGHTPG